MKTGIELIAYELTAVEIDAHVAIATEELRKEDKAKYDLLCRIQHILNEADIQSDTIDGGVRQLQTQLAASDSAFMALEQASQRYQDELKASRALVEKLNIIVAAVFGGDITFEYSHIDIRPKLECWKLQSNKCLGDWPELWEVIHKAQALRESDFAEGEK